MKSERLIKLNIYKIDNTCLKCSCLPITVSWTGTVSLTLSGFNSPLSTPLVTSDSTISPYPLHLPLSSTPSISSPHITSHIHIATHLPTSSKTCTFVTALLSSLSKIISTTVIVVTFFIMKIFLISITNMS
jgi:hypothetical protein